MMCIKDKGDYSDIWGMCSNGTKIPVTHTKIYQKLKTCVVTETKMPSTL